MGHVQHIEHGWRLASANLAVFALICALTFAAGIDATVLAS
jgi:hypothetical protein